MVTRGCRAAIVGLVSLVILGTPLAFGGTVPWLLAALEAAVWLALACWLITIALEEAVELVVCPVVAPVITVATYAVVRYATAEVEPLARREMMLVVTGALLFVLVLNTLQRRWHVNWLVGAWSSLGVALAIWGGWQWLSGRGSVWGWPQPDLYAGRASGPFLRPSHYAAYLSMLVAVCGGFFLFSRWRYRIKLWLVCVCAALSVGVLLAFSVAGWAGWLAATLVLGAYAVRRRGMRARWFVIGAGLWLALVIAAIIVLPDRRLVGNELPLWSLWEVAVRVGCQNLLFGAGPGMLRCAYPAQRVFQGQVLYANNEYLNVFADYGLVGVLLIGWLVTSFIQSSIRIIEARARRYSIDALSNRYAIVAAGLAAVAAAAVHALFDFNLHVPAITLSLNVLMALVLTCGVHPHGHLHDNESVEGQFRTVTVTGVTRWLLMLGLLLVLMLQGSRLMTSGPADWYLWRGQCRQTRLDWDGARTELLHAWHFDPHSYTVAEALGDLLVARATWNAQQSPALWKEALGWYERAVSRNPYEYDVLVKMARLFDAAGQRDKAAEHLQRAIQADPRNASYHAQLGLHYERWGDRPNALASFQRAADLDDSDRLVEQQLRLLETP